MERVYHNDSKITSSTDSWIYEDEDPQYYILQNEPSNHVGSVQYFGSNLHCLPIHPVLQPLVGHMINTSPLNNHDLRNGPNFLPYESQLHYFQQPMFHWNPTRAQGFSQQNFPLPEDYSLGKGANGDTGYTSEDTYRDFEGSDAAFGLGLDVLPIKENIGSVKTSLSDESDRTIPIEQSYSQQQPGYKNGVGTNQTKSSVVSSTLRTLGSTLRVLPRRNKWIQSIRDHAPRFRVGNRKALVPRLVKLKKIKAQPAANISKRSSKISSPTHHITWDGFAEESEPAGQNCPLCNEDLSCAPTAADEYEYFDVLVDEPLKLPDVSALSCGHVFHSQCLELIIPEEQFTGPPCYLCLSCTES